MRSLLMSVALALGVFGFSMATPTQARADDFRGVAALTSATTLPAHWHGGRYWGGYYGGRAFYPGWGGYYGGYGGYYPYGGFGYSSYYPGYYGGFGYPGYYGGWGYGGLYGRRFYGW